MYLAPLNYDRFFKKVFSNIKIAKRFLEDFLDIKIEEIKFLPTKHSITDDAQIVEFDFWCNTEEGYFVIEMQQWYKPDVVQRFYVYHALNTSLQLENMPKKLIPIKDKKSKEVHDYTELMPTITIIWMVSDTLNFKVDYVSYVLTPEYITTFLQDSKEWTTENCHIILEKRKKMNALLNNTKKNIGFLQKNKLIYVFQSNIVKNKSITKYYKWFEFAQKTLNKEDDRLAYEKYRKDEIFCEIIRRLEKSLKEKGSLEYIKTYEEYQAGIARYNRGIEKKQKEKYETELKEAKAREEEERRQKEEAKAREKEERRQKEEALNKAKENSLKLAVFMLKSKITDHEIMRETGITKEVLNKLKKENL